MTILEASTFLRVSESTVRRLVRTGKLKQVDFEDKGKLYEALVEHP